MTKGNILSFEKRVSNEKKNGAKVIAPNNLPITCIRGDGTLLEHEEADHPTYMFPITVRYEGVLDERDTAQWASFCGRELTLEEVRDCLTEEHALIYTDGYIAITIYETCYAMFSVNTGKPIGGRYSADRVLSEESLEKIRKHCNVR